ncbi:hypothetical protein SGL43_05310 [Streptomyces globisporus]|uniref:Uncharacterized protein n=1 Tax=Streptomyces globisporus TaxID=1908 RepID=A0ABM9H3Q7_STRGL|nr:hypothetical protein SGL43_05310 [Streptomyces globisporus]
MRVGAPVPEGATGPIVQRGPMIFEGHPHSGHDQAFPPLPDPYPRQGTVEWPVGVR